MKLILPPASRNSRKKQIIQELTVAFATYDLKKVSSFLAVDVEWILVGDQPIEGKEKFLHALNKMSNNKASLLQIHQILTQGKNAAVHGEMTMKDGKVYGFADFYVFKSSRSELVNLIRSYVIQLK
jgi:ketosteroid isomerase-like protein